MYLVLALVISGLYRSVSTTSCKSSTAGREFHFGILDSIYSCCHNSDNIVALDITNVSPNDARVRLQIPFFNNDTYFYIPSGERKTVTIDPSIQRDGTFKDARGLRITSESDISVQVTNAFNSPNSIDTYNIVPVTELGNSYMASSYRGNDIHYGSVILVAGVTNDTQVTFHNGTNILQVVLKKFEVFQYFCNQMCDLTGVLVQSSKDVYVVSGSSYSGVPYSPKGSNLEYIASEMFPTSAWSYNYIVPPVLPKSAFMIRLISQSSFDVTVSNLTRSYKFSASKADQYFGTEAVVATADRPFSVTQYGVNYQYDGLAGDPFMAVVPAVEQYINNYVFTVPHGYYGVKHYAAIIAPTISMSGLVLDGFSIQYYNSTRIKVPAPFDNYTILTFPVKEGYHHFYHSSQAVTFGVFMYGHGFNIWGLSYGFYAGFSLRRGNCSTSVTTSTRASTTTTTTTTTTSTTTTATTTTTTTTTTPPTTTTSSSTSKPILTRTSSTSITTPTRASTTTTSSSTSIPILTSTSMLEAISPLQSRRQMCYSCDDLSDINLCDTVKHCSKSEICFVGSYIAGGQTKYRTGCLQENICESKRNDSMYSDDLCFECCHGDYCNNKGCGENGIPDRDQRGPICFDCQHVSSPEQCIKISPCQPHQLCLTEEYKWFDHSHFKLGCGHGLCYPVNRMGNHVFRRETPVCQACCSDDYCNKNCTISSQGQTGSVIVG